MFHDTHAHVDFLLQRQGLLPPQDRLDLESPKNTPLQDIVIDKTCVDELLSGHDWVIQPTVSTGNFRLVYNLLKVCSKIYFGLGSHPDMVKADFDVEDYVIKQRDIVLTIEADEKLYNQVVAIGECGLDYFHAKDDEARSRQRALFESQIEVALRLKLPLIIHCREAFPDLFEILKEYPDIHGHFVVHCFTASTKELQKIIEFGGLVGIGGVVTFNSAADLQETIKYCPENCFVLETDLPFLAPVPHRGQICLPEFIDDVAHKLAELRGVTVQKIWELSLQNSKTIFGEL